MIFKRGQKILFIGDSITDTERRTHHAPYGNGYVSMIRNLLLARYPELNLMIVNHGISGNTTRDLATRWQRDAINVMPDWLSLKIGINDAWRSLNQNVHEAILLPEYTANLRSLLDQTQANTRANLILMAPYIIESRRTDRIRERMDSYGKVVAELATEYGALFIDTQKAFDTVLQHTIPADWAEDRIHPDAPGHAVIALAFLRAVGFEL